MKSDFCETDRNHLREVVSDRIWTDASQSEQLQTLRSDLTVREVTLRDARPDPMRQSHNTRLRSDVVATATSQMGHLMWPSLNRAKCDLDTC